VNTTIVFGVCIAMFRSVPSDARVCSRIRAGRFGVAGERSYQLQLCPGEAFEGSVDKNLWKSMASQEGHAPWLAIDFAESSVREP
jgi:hypothetical protein